MKSDRRRKLMKKVTRKAILSVAAVFVAISFVGITAVAQANGRAANIKSTGIINFKDGAAVIDTTDFIYLANEIDLLENTYKSEMVSSLNEMGTYFTSEGSVTHNIDESMILPESAEVLAFGQLTDGILNSQSIPEDKSYSGILPGSDETVTGTLSAASADNLSLGTAAWVNGELLYGTGSDNSSYYNQGYADGIANINNGSIVYTYHEHSDSCFKTCRVTYDITVKYGNGLCNVNIVHHECGQSSQFLTGVPYTGQSTEYHDYYICGKTESTIESATIVFD